MKAAGSKVRSVEKELIAVKIKSNIRGIGKQILDMVMERIIS